MEKTGLRKLLFYINEISEENEFKINPFNALLNHLFRNGILNSEELNSLTFNKIIIEMEMKNFGRIAKKSSSDRNSLSEDSRFKAFNEVIVGSTYSINSLTSDNL